jgi:MFS family permease
MTDKKLFRWIDRNILELGREMRLSYLPPLMVYLAAGIQGLTGIVGTFFVKEYLGLSAAFLAALGFWAVIPWSIKMVIGHLVDLIWRWKSVLIFLGAALIAASLLIMAGLIGNRAAMAALLPVESWFVIAALLAPVGYVLQDAVADAMTVEAVPRVDPDGIAIEPARRRLMHTTMQTLGRVAIIGGTVLVALINLLLFQGSEHLAQAEKVEIYRSVYLMALVIPVVSVAGVLIAGRLARRDRARLLSKGLSVGEVDALLATRNEAPAANWWILGGGLLFVLFTLAMGLSKLEWNQEIILFGSLAIVLFMMTRLVRELEPEARATLIGTAVVIFVFRAVPGPGPGVTWWMIDALGFDQAFLSVLSLIGSTLTLAGMFLFRRFMAERSITYVVGFLTLAGFLLGLPILGMSFGFHEWTARLTGGMVDARFIALIDTALESPLGQIAMIPMLAWIANCAPDKLKATYFAVMASFTNLALSASQLGTKYLNQIYDIRRELRDPLTHTVASPADYSDLQPLLISAIVLGLVLPFAAILAARAMRLRSA